MGYPMTFQRFVKRSQLERGDYSIDLDVPWTTYYWPRGYVKDAFSEELRREFDRQNGEREELGRKLKLLTGDLRRLEKDATDENAVCKYIAFRTGIDVEIVAAVLKEFIAW